MSLSIRLDKIISDAGLASRREIAALIRRGCITIDGEIADSCSKKYDPHVVEISLNGKIIEYKRYHYIMMNKPAGYVSSTEDTREKTVLELLRDELKGKMLFPVGRLDKDAEGLLILTNDGEFAHRIISPKKKVDKTYYVETNGALTEDDCNAFSKGIILKDGLHCLPGYLEILSVGETSKAHVTICEGKYHQVKRMLASRGKPVLFLKRISVGALFLDPALKTGEYREIGESERNQIFLERAKRI